MAVRSDVELDHRRKRRPSQGHLLVKRVGRAIRDVFVWMLRGYQRANAGDLAAAVAFNGMIALVPTFLLFMFVGGLFLQQDSVLAAALYASYWALPPEDARDALEVVLNARRNTGWFGVVSLLGFIWIGANFVSSLGRCMNRVYGVRDHHIVHQRVRGFVVVVIFATLFIAATIAATIPTLFVRQTLPFYFEDWALAASPYQIGGYAIAIAAAVTLFSVLYRFLPNAGQRLADIWPGTIAAAFLFVVFAQVFPLYFRFIGISNRFGQVFGLVTLLVIWFYVLAHVLLFCTYINASYQLHRRGVSEPTSRRL